MTTVPSFTDFLAEGRMPGALPALVKEAKRVNDELASLVELVKEKTREAESYDREVAAKLEAMGETTKKVGRILVSVEQKPGRVSYSYKEAEKMYYDALMRVNKAAAAVTAKLVESLKHVNPGKTEVSYSLAESALDGFVRWVRGAWAAVVRAFSPWERAVDELERAVGVGESAMYEGYGLGRATREEAREAIKQHKLKPTSWAGNVAYPKYGDDLVPKWAKFFSVSDEDPPRVIAYAHDPNGPSGGRYSWVEFTT